MSIFFCLLLAPTVVYKDYAQLRLIGIIISLVAALAIFFVFLAVSRKVKRQEEAGVESKSRREMIEPKKELSPPPTNEPFAEMLTERQEASPDETEAPGPSAPYRTEDPVDIEVAQEQGSAIEDYTENESVQEDSTFVEEKTEPVEIVPESAKTPESESIEEIVTKESVVAREASEVADTNFTFAAVQPDEARQPADAVTATDVAAVEVAATETVATDELPLPEFINEIADELDGEDRRAFAYYIIDATEPLKTRVKHPLGVYEKEKEFLKDFFISYAKYKKLLNPRVFEVLYSRYSRLVRDDGVRTKLNNKMINVLFFNRKADSEYLDRCKKLCKKDIELNFEKIDARDCRVPALKRLILIEASEKNYDAAIRWCDSGINRNLVDKKDEGFEERREKLIEKKEKHKLRLEKQREKQLVREKQNKEQISKEAK